MAKATKVKEITIADKLDKLAELQKIHTKIDEIQVLKGELPIEVSDLEDEIAGLNIRISKIQADIENQKEEVASRRLAIEESETLIQRYDAQINAVKNNREFDALTKEIEMQRLEIQLSEKKIKESSFGMEQAEKNLADTTARLEQKQNNLDGKKVELDQIVAETEKEERELLAKIEKVEAEIDERLLKAYKRIRSSYKNGLAVVKVERDSCGGCFGKIPPQTQSEIRLKKKVLVCEHCGRILYDVLDFDGPREVSATTLVVMSSLPDEVME
jgi:uncharacterized protein